MTRKIKGLPLCKSVKLKPQAPEKRFPNSLQSNFKMQKVDEEKKISTALVNKNIKKRSKNELMCNNTEPLELLNTTSSAVSSQQQAQGGGMVLT